MYNETKKNRQVAMQYADASPEDQETRRRKCLGRHLFA